jgi:hypothetical protein
MAVFLTANYGTTAAEIRPVDDGTTPISAPLRSKTPKKPNGLVELLKTATDIDEETGNEEEINQSFSLTLPSLATQQAIVQRIEVANQLARLAKKVIESKGKIKMAADLQVLRRELARAHHVLRDLRSERDYLSVITVVEAAMQNIDWKEVSRGELEQIHLSLSLGTNVAAVNFDDVNRQARQFRGQGVSTLPTFDIHDGEDEEVAEEDTDSTVE